MGIEIINATCAPIPVYSSAGEYISSSPLCGMNILLVSGYAHTAATITCPNCLARLARNP